MHQIKPARVFKSFPSLGRRCTRNIFYKPLHGIAGRGSNELHMLKRGTILGEFCLTKKFSSEPVRESMLPNQLVESLNEHIIGHMEAKKSLAVVLRDRWRRQQMKNNDLRNETTPNNILLIGPSGCGKTELARRIAQITEAPFVKVVATKYTEVGFVGDDTHSMINDLAQQAYLDERRRYRAKISNETRNMAENHIIMALRELEEYKDVDESVLSENIRAGKMDDVMVDIDCDLLTTLFEKPGSNPFQQVMDLLTGNPTGRPGGVPPGSGSVSAFPVHLVLSKPPTLGNAASFFKKMDSSENEDKNEYAPVMNRPQKTISVKNALPLLEEHFSSELINEEELIANAKYSAENKGIIFIDEFDKLIEGREGNEFRSKNRGVQKELLSLMDGTSVNTTRLGRISTEFILFVASGAFHTSKPSDIMPELQGRLPVRSELQPLDVNDLERILLDTKYSLLKQEVALLETEGIDLSFTPEAIRYIAQISHELNTMLANIGARRLKTVFAKLLEEIKFDVPTFTGQKIIVDVPMVEQRLKTLLQHVDLSKYII